LEVAFFVLLVISSYHISCRNIAKNLPLEKCAFLLLWELFKSSRRSCLSPIWSGSRIDEGVPMPLGVYEEKKKIMITGRCRKPLVIMIGHIFSE